MTKSDAYAFGGASGRQGALNRENPELGGTIRRPSGQGDWQCQSCMYEYRPKVGDDFYPSPRGRNLRICPRTGGARRAGRIRRSLSRSGRRWRFEQNQGYGLSQLR